MKKIINILICTIALLTISITTFAEPKSKKAKVEEVTFQTNLHCGSCAKKIESKLPFEKGVKDMKIDVENKTVWLKFSPSKTDKATLVKAINKIGFQAEEIKAEKKKEE